VSEESVKVKAGRLGFCRDVVLLSYPVIAIGFAVLRNGGGFDRTSDADDLFFRRALRIYDLLRFRPLGGSGRAISAYAQPLGFMGGLALQVTFVASCICLAAVLAVAIRALVPEKVARAVLHPRLAFAGILIFLLYWWAYNIGKLSLPPAIWLWCFYDPVVWRAWLFLVSTAMMPYVAFRLRPMTYLAALTYGLFAVVHFGFWFVTLVSGRVFWLPFVLVSAFTAGKGVLWLTGGNELMSPGVPRERANAGPGFALAVALMSLGVLLLLWLPPKGYSISRTPDMRSLVIRLDRAGGSEGPMAYSVTVYGDGRVVYSGVRRVAVRGLRAAFVQPYQVRRLAESLDRIGFFELDGRTFLACPDAPSVTISVSIAGKKNTVTSACGGSGMPESEEEVARVAQEIDGTVGSDQWTRCTGPCWP
jgi:hypothetical protein